MNYSNACDMHSLPVPYKARSAAGNALRSAAVRITFAAACALCVCGATSHALAQATVVQVNAAGDVVDENVVPLILHDSTGSYAVWGGHSASPQYDHFTISRWSPDIAPVMVAQYRMFPQLNDERHQYYVQTAKRQMQLPNQAVISVATVTLGIEYTPNGTPLMMDSWSTGFLMATPTGWKSPVSFGGTLYSTSGVAPRFAGAVDDEARNEIVTWLTDPAGVSSIVTAFAPDGSRRWVFDVRLPRGTDYSLLADDSARALLRCGSILYRVTVKGSDSVLRFARVGLGATFQRIAGNSILHACYADSSRRAIALERIGLDGIVHDSARVQCVDTATGFFIAVNPRDTSIAIMHTTARGVWTTFLNGHTFAASQPWLLSAEGNRAMHPSATIVGDTLYAAWHDLAAGTWRVLATAMFITPGMVPTIPGAPTVDSNAVPSVDLADGPLWISIAPNPTVDHATVIVRSDGGVYRLELVDPLGRRIRSEERRLDMRASREWPLDLRGVAPGVYFIRVSGAKGSAAARLVVLR